VRRLTRFVPFHEGAEEEKAAGRDLAICPFTRCGEKICTLPRPRQMEIINQLSKCRFMLT
jgi:hypothetical protein